MKYKRMMAVWLVAVLLAVIGAAQSVYTIQSATGALTAGATTSTVTSRGRFATITLDVTTLTLADADDEVDFYIQTIYDNTNWVDVQNIHFDNSDNGATAKRVIVIDGALDGPGSIKSITGTNPAAGAEISETVPANAIWKLTSFYFMFVTDATVTSRSVRLSMSDSGGTTFAKLVRPAAQAASVTNRFIYGAGLEHSATYFSEPLMFDSILLPSYVVTTATTTNIQAGDDYAAPQMLVEEWHDPLILTDGTIRDNVRSYGRPLGTDIRIKTTVTGATAPTYAYSASVLFQ